MKLIIENPLILETVIQDEMNEAIGMSERNYYIQGIFSTPEVKNRNGRIYPRSLWEREVKEYQKEILERTVNSLGENEHPPSTDINIANTVIRIVELKINEDGNVWGKAKILNDNTHLTNKLKGFIKEGMKIGVSSRGLGSVNEDGIVEDFKLITYDVVSMPSDYNAMLTGLQEGYQFLNGMATNKEFKLDESGCISECSLEIPKKVEKIDETTLDEFSGDYVYVQALKSILNSKGAEKLCDLSLDMKEDVLSQFVDMIREYDGYVKDYDIYLESQALKNDKTVGYKELAKKLREYNGK